VFQPWETVPEDLFEERADDPGHALCPSCLEPTRWNANFCHTCLCPLTWYAGTGPLERVFAWPWIMGRAATTRWPRRIHPWGVTVHMGLPVLFAPLVGFLFFDDDRVYGWSCPEFAPGFAALASLLAIAVAVLSVLLYVLFTIRAWVNYLDRRHVDPWADEEEADTEMGSSV